MKVLAIIALAAAAFTHGAPARAADCDRACLASLMERYLVALDARDPKLLPLARGAKFTENTVALTLGDGFWQTIDKGSQSATSRLIIADPATSQVAPYGAAKENGHGVRFGVRLKHKAQRISEIEQFVVRRGPAQIGEFDHPTALDAAWTEALPAAERLPRAELVRIASRQSFNDGHIRAVLFEIRTALVCSVLGAGNRAILQSLEKRAIFEYGV